MVLPVRCFLIAPIFSDISHMSMMLDTEMNERAVPATSTPSPFKKLYLAVLINAAIVAQRRMTSKTLPMVFTKFVQNITNTSSYTDF